MLPSHLSIEITQRCSKGCVFCYASSASDGAPGWKTADILSFAESVVAEGVTSISLGGGEPLEHADWRGVLDGLRPLVARTITTNGLPLTDPAVFADFVAAGPDKVHVSIHHPRRTAEVERVVRQVLDLEAGGLASGVNLVVRRSELAAAAGVVQRLGDVGVGLDRIVLLPLRGGDPDETPSPTEIARVAGSAQFRATSCLTRCASSPRFASIGWDHAAAWCSYTTSRRRLPTLDAHGLRAALRDLPLRPCAIAARTTDT